MLFRDNGSGYFYWGFDLGFGILCPIMQNQLEKIIDNEMEALGPFKGVYGDCVGMVPDQLGKISNKKDRK